ncbi:S8 family peptidase [Cryptosporangium phraense]|uniref:S8 family serine peptidase n=1 Tax=Cryptosporangium phraense TaxID=2593070 RepID=A0A545AMU3_9ACTN|nr:S8 family serine peptidase [Cryptosporangium phraense]TQS42590.1 S8 family serine peptidase [Cryptosporangium phraense]
MTPTLELVAPSAVPRVTRSSPFVVLPDGRGSSVLVVAGEVLVRRGDLPAARRFAVAHGLRAEPVPGLAGRVVRLAGPALLADLAGLLHEAREGGVPVTAHHVAPMAGYIKALDGPRPAEAGRPFERSGAGSCVVAVLDTGADARPRGDGWLAGLADADNVEPTGTLAAGTGHGTFVAGIVQQVAPSATVRAYRVMDADGAGSDARVAAAMLRAADDGADVLNLSLGTRTIGDEPPIAFEAALELLAERHPQTLVVAAAGNDGEDRPCWPAAFPDVAAVAGLTRDRTPSAWSNRGGWVLCSARAEDVVSTFVEGHRAIEGGRPATFGADPWASWTGTSFAAPQVAAAVAAGCAEHGVTPRESLATLLAGRPTADGYGATLDILAS